MPDPVPVHRFGSPFIELQSIDSTNAYARRQIEDARLSGATQKLQAGTTYFSHEQTAGKGQRGRSWISERGVNILMSVLLRPHQLDPVHPFQLNCCVALALHDFFAKYAGDEVKIKWPNDLYWKNRKAGGILIESLIAATPTATQQVAAQKSRWDWAIVGIGVNINQDLFPEALPNPVSLKQITGHFFPLVPLAKELCVALQKRWDELLACKFDSMHSAYNKRLFRAGEKQLLKKEHHVFDAIIHSVSKEGQLIVLQNTMEYYEFGTVEWVV